MEKKTHFITALSVVSMLSTVTGKKEQTGLKVTATRLRCTYDSLKNKTSELLYLNPFSPSSNHRACYKLDHRHKKKALPKHDLCFIIRVKGKP
jgi:hypothetical protein